MKSIDDFIQRHAGQFDTDEPEHGHVDRFKDKLGSTAVSRKPELGALLFRVAAVLLICALITFFSIREFGLIKSQLSMATDKANQELNEAERFYNSQLNIYYNKINQLHFNNDQAEKKQVLQELSAMDEQVQAMKSDLKQNPDDERIMSAIINFYQVKIETMDVIIARAQQQHNTIL
jgi:hypothetical protein